MVVICLNVSLPPPDCSGLQRWALPRAFACLALFYSWLVALGNASWGNDWMNEWMNKPLYLWTQISHSDFSPVFLPPSISSSSSHLFYFNHLWSAFCESDSLRYKKRPNTISFLTIPQCRGADRYVRWLPFAENSSCAGFGLSTLPTRYLLILSKFPKLGNNYLHFTDENVKA